MSRRSPSRTGADPARLARRAAGRRRLDRHRPQACGLVGHAVLDGGHPDRPVLATTSGARRPRGRWPRCRCSSGWARSCSARGCPRRCSAASRPWLQWLPGRLMHVNVLGLRHLRFGLRLLGRDLRHHRQDRPARTEEARLRRDGEPRLAGGRRHARHPDPALDHDGGLCGGGERLDHPGVPRRLPARPARDGALLGLHHRLGAAQPGQGRRRPSRRCRSARSCGNRPS